MKIIQVITKPHMGGAQKHVLDLLSHLKTNNIDALLLTGRDSYRPLIDECEKGGIDFDFVTGLSRDIETFSDLKALIFLYKYFKKNKPDIVHLHSSKAGGLGTLSARLAGVKKIIFTAHGTPFKEDRNIFSRTFLYILSTFTVLLSHKTICVSQAVYNSYPKSISTKKCVVIHNGIHDIDFLDKGVAQKSLSISQDFINVGVIAELNKNKGLSFLVDAFSQLPENTVRQLKIYIAGQGDDKKNLQKQILGYNLSEKIILLGHLHGASRYLKAFDILVMPSINEGLPYVLLEAGKTGLPIIATDVGGIPEVIENGVTGLLVKSRSAGQIKNALQEFINQREIFSKYALNLNNFVSKEFNIEKMLSEIENIYSITIQDQETHY